jgi:hypothetical protein
MGNPPAQRRVGWVFWRVTGAHARARAGGQARVLELRAVMYRDVQYRDISVSLYLVAVVELS